MAKNSTDELIPQVELDKVDSLKKGLTDLKGIVISLVQESSKLRMGSFDGNNLNAAVNAQKKMTEATNELGLTTRVYNNLKKIENELLKVNTDSIDEARLKVRQLTIERNALNLKTQEGAVKQNELNKKIDEYNKFVKNNVDLAQQQKMNIGNYASALDGLRFSTVQVVRELPSLNNGLNVLISAWGNNFPMLMADIQRLIAVNKELAASGKPTTSVFTALASSIFSWQTALIAVLTVAPKLVDVFSDTSSEGDKARKSISDFDSSIKSMSETIGTETTKLKGLLDTAQDTTLTYKERGKAVDDLQKMYPDYFAKMDREKILNGEIGKSYEDLTREIIENAKAKGRAALITEKATELAQAELELEKLTTQKRGTFLLVDDLSLQNAKNKVGFKKQELELLQQQNEDERMLREGAFMLFKDEKQREAYFAKQNHEKSEALMTEDERKNYKKRADARIEAEKAMLAALRKLIIDDQESQGQAETDALGHSKGLQILLEKYKEFNAEKSALFAESEHFTQLKSENEAGLLNVTLEANRAHNKKILEDEEKTKNKRIEIAKDTAYAKVRLEQEAANALLVIGDLLLEGESKFLDKRASNSEKTKEQQLAYIESLNISEQDRRDRKYAAEKEAFSREKDIDAQRESLEKKKFTIEQSAALANILFSTQRAAAEIQARAAVLLATPATAGLAPLALAQLPYVYASGAISAALIGAKVLSYKDGTPAGGHPGGAAEVAEAGLPEFMRKPGEEWKLVTEHTLFPSMPKGTEVMPIDKASDAMLTPKMLKSIAGMSGINLNPLIKEVRSMKDAIERKPVGSINVAKGAIFESLRIGNNRINRIKRGILD